MAKAILHGFPISSGLATGTSFFFNKRPGPVPHIFIPRSAITKEIQRFKEAVETVIQNITDVIASLPEGFGAHKDILDTHALICQDPNLYAETIRRIQERRMNAEWALQETLSTLATSFKKINTPYIKERLQDIHLVCGKIIQALQGARIFSPLPGDTPVLLAHDISPEETLDLSRNAVLAFVTEQGGPTSHSGIIARSLGIPAVVGVRGLEDEIKDGSFVIVDGFSGKIFVDPNPDEVESCKEKAARFQEFHQKLVCNASFPAETIDGYKVNVFANIDVSPEAKEVLEIGGEGIGLVRTEFAYIAHGAVPEEDELYRSYSHLAKLFSLHPVTFRTLDVGADKLLNVRRENDEENPALGLRAVRFCMRHQDIFRSQLRAVLRASAHGRLSLMFPMISGLEELRTVRSILNEAKQELDAEGISFDADIPIGIMLELPSAVFMAPELAREIDFFSIGTNDLIQYMMGADRGNPNVAYLHQPFNPAVLRAIKYVVDTAHETGIPVSICGEMAANAYCIPLLLGMPVDTLSVSTQSIPLVKHIVRHSQMHECRDLLATALASNSSRHIKNLVMELVYNRFSADVAFFPAEVTS